MLDIRGAYLPDLLLGLREHGGNVAQLCNNRQAS